MGVDNLDSGAGAVGQWPEIKTLLRKLNYGSNQH
jgi:hypothetical protein